MNNNKNIHFGKKMNLRRARVDSASKIVYRVVSNEKEVPCLTMQNYTFTKNAVRKRKKEIFKNLKNANSLISNELRVLSK